MFTIFLRKGYALTTLDSVDSGHFSRLQYCKLLLGMRITLHDDLADNPLLFNPKLLRELYSIPFRDTHRTPPFMGEQDQSIFEMAMFIHRELFTEILDFPNFCKLENLFEFDLEMTDLGTKYSAVITESPNFSNLRESVAFGHYNMGMMAAATLDMMASSSINLDSVGRYRDVFLLGQRMGRISNLIATFDREVAEGDETSEVLIHGRQKSELAFPAQKYLAALEEEFKCKLEEIQIIASNEPDSSFSINSYANGLVELHNLHLSLMGTI